MKRNAKRDCGSIQLYDLFREVRRYFLTCRGFMTVEQEDIIPNDYAGNMGII